MTTRELPREEWHRLDGTELAPFVAGLPASVLTVLVVEQDGAIVGCWGLVVSLHAEGLWIAPEHRRGTAVGRRLLLGMRHAVANAGAQGVLTGAASDEVVSLLEHVKAERLPYVPYFWSMKES